MLKRHVKKLSKRLSFDELEYAYGEFTFRIGSNTIAESDIHNNDFQKQLKKFRVYLQSRNVSEMLIENS